MTSLPRSNTVATLQADNHQPDDRSVLRLRLYDEPHHKQDRCSTSPASLMGWHSITIVTCLLCIPHYNERLRYVPVPRKLPRAAVSTHNPRQHTHQALVQDRRAHDSGTKPDGRHSPEPIKNKGRRQRSQRRVERRGNPCKSARLRYVRVLCAGSMQARRSKSDPKRTQGRRHGDRRCTVFPWKEEVRDCCPH